MRPTDGLSSSEKPDFAFTGPSYWIRKPLRTLISRNARRQPLGAGRIFSHNFPQKISGWEVGECISLAPHYHYRLGINRRVWGFGLKENKSVTLKLAYTLEESAFDH